MNVTPASTDQFENAGKDSRQPPWAQCILVAGMHRSGTSVTARLASLLGARISTELMGPVAGNNDRGFWESQVLYRIHERLLTDFASAWDDVAPLPRDWMSSPAAATAGEEIRRELERDFGAARLFVVKDPRLTRLLPLWLSVLDGLRTEPVVVIPFRNPLEVARSLARREGFSLSKALLSLLRGQS